MNSDTRQPLSLGWKVFLCGALIAGAILRLIWVGDMEYKSDEAYMFDRVMAVGKTEPWPWLGVASGVHLRNPGMSVWVFLGLGKIFGVETPTDLARAVQLLNVAALLLLAYFAARWVESRNRGPWLWATALACVNPFAILYHRKIWAQSVLPFFCMLFLMAWWKRSSKAGAFFWGLIGACLGQIHMSGFFFGAAFAAWTLIFDTLRDRKDVRWGAWFFGSLAGSFTLIPWIIHFFVDRQPHPMVFGWVEAVQLKFWVFWMTDAVGLHLGNPLGVKLGNAWHQQLGDFFRYPLISGTPTYGVAVLHAAAVLWVAAVLPRAAYRALRGLRGAEKKWDSASDTARAQSAALLAYGGLMTAATLKIYRFYLLITFPFEWVWLSRTTRLAYPARAHAWLGALFVIQLLMSASFLGYIHVNGGSIHGDYGPAYRVQQ